MFVPLVLPAMSYSAQIPSTVVEVIHDSSHIVALEQEGINTDFPLVPLRSMLEPKGIVIKYNSQNDSKRNTITFTLYIGSNNIGSTEVHLNRGRRSEERLFFLEYPPRIINGQTMVPSNFIQEVLDTVENRNEYFKKVAVVEDISNNSIEKHKGYTYYCPKVGPETGPTFDQAILYIVEHKLLKLITGLENTLHGFEEFGSRSTMVVGEDEQGRKKTIWLIRNKYTEQISMIASVYLDQIITKDVIYYKMRTKGITKKDIKKIHLAPYVQGKLLWYVKAEKNNLNYYIAFDCFSGEVYQEWCFARNQE